MKIEKISDGKELTLKIIGRLDTTTAPELDGTIAGSVSGIETLVFDFSELEYISSAGLRVLLSAQKKMNKQGKMTVKNVNETVLEVLEITGFCDILDIEK